MSYNGEFGFVKKFGKNKSGNKYPEKEVERKGGCVFVRV
jgi:hypothetical protein